MKNKKGWMLILEATIAILIISGVLIAVYSKQMDRGIDPADYYNSLQGQILADVSERTDLRLNVLNVIEEDFGDEDFVELNDFIGGKIPSGFGYSIRVCALSDPTDHCKMRTPIFIATMDENIYVEEIIISAELGNGTNAVYNPKKLRLFVWEGESVGMDCENECPDDGPIFSCSADSTQVLKRICGNFDNDFCLEYNGSDFEVFETCDEGEICAGSPSICTLNFVNLTCERKTVSETGCVWTFDDECDEWNGGGRVTGDCGFLDLEEEYECYNIETLVTDCLESPVCPLGYSEVARRSCVPAGEDICYPAGPVYSCSADTTQVLTRTCGDFNDDGYLEWDGDFVVNSTCGAEEMCKNGACVPAWAALSLTFSDVVYGLETNVDIDGTVYPEVYYYTHTRTFEETNGVGVNLTEGELCQELLEVCNSASVSYRIEGSDNLIYTNKQFYTTLDEETFTLKYWGIDDNGNAVYVEQVMTVAGPSYVL